MCLLLVNSLALLPAPRSPQPPHHDHLSRRVLLGGATFAALSASPVASWADMPVLPEYDAEGKPVNLQGYLEDVAFRTVKVGPTTANLLRDWKWEPEGGLVDPVQGSTATLLQLRSSDSTLTKVEDLGKPENVYAQRSPRACASLLPPRVDRRGPCARAAGGW